ncbi:MAG: helix-turn-helix domain-containing protein [Muribaculaceae bacterium]|nr:helix-turn-helix domain-containing protein [Muribaculaceae bacterium]
MATSNIRIKKVCQWCGNEFEAQKTTTQYCCKRCAEHAYKERKRQEKKKITETLDSLTARENKINQLSGRDYLSVAEVAQILNVTPRSVYNLIYRGTIKAYRLTSQWAVIKRADIDAMIEARPYERKPKATALANDENGEAISEFYTTKEIIEKFGVSNSWVFAQGKAHNIPKVYHRGKTLWSKTHCDRVFTAKPETPKEKDWISYSDVRAEYNLTHDQLHNYVKYHGLRRKKVGKYSYIFKSEIDAILRPPTLK